MFGSLDISASALVAQRTRLDVISANLAGKDALTDAQGNYAPYRRRVVVFGTGDPATGSAEGLHVSAIEQDQSEFRKVYDRGHPFADADGYVDFPNVDPVIENINAMDATRAYEANIAAAEATKSMLQSSLRLLA